MQLSVNGSHQIDYPAAANVRLLLVAAMVEDVVAIASGILERIGLVCGASRTDMLQLHRLWVRAIEQNTTVAAPCHRTAALRELLAELVSILLLPNVARSSHIPSGPGVSLVSLLMISLCPRW